MTQTCCYRVLCQGREVADRNHRQTKVWGCDLVEYIKTEEYELKKLTGEGGKYQKDEWRTPRRYLGSDHR